MEYTFIEGLGKSTNNIIYISPKSELSKDKLVDKLNELGKLSNDEKIKINLDKIISPELKVFIIDMLTTQSYNYKNPENVKNIDMPGNSVIGNVINECRHIIDSPANIMHANAIISYMKKNTPKNITITILNEKQLKKLNMNLLVGMNSGSKYPASMAILTYKKTNVSPIVLVGKGVIFDSGGLNIKNSDFSNMKSDKTGAIYVWGLIKTLSLNNINGHFVGILPFIENMPSSKALHPGDVLKGCSGKTVEVTNTDAEGRIILADAMCWANKHIENPRLTIDIATLTGMAVAIFGSLGSAIMCNKKGEKITKQLIEIGDNNGEYFWQLPLHHRYLKYLESDVADYKNYNADISADTIMAGMFLAEFAPKNTPWLHLDIAGVAYREQSTGEPMLSIYQLLTNLS
jgi:leucyl aminopeptidase